MVNERSFEVVRGDVPINENLFLEDDDLDTLEEELQQLEVNG